MINYSNDGHIYKDFRKHNKIGGIIMKIISIEATPNPNSMRVVFDTELPSGTSHNYRKSDAETASEPAASLLKLDGIKGIYHVMNFMAIEKDSDVEWEEILANVEAIIPKN